jgi:putative ABC transport system permease protein
VTGSWRLALRNLGRNRKRNLATGSAIAFGFAGILMLSAYTYRARNYIRVYTVYVVHTGHLAIFAPGGFENFAFKPAHYSISKEDQDRITAVLKNDPEVERWEPQVRGMGLIGNGCTSFPFIAQGYDPGVDQALREHPQVREWMPSFRYLLEGNGISNYPLELGAVLLSRGLSLALGKTKLHDSFPPASAPAAFTAPDCTQPKVQATHDANVQLLGGTWTGQMGATDGEVVGLYTTGMQETDSSGLVTSVDRLQKLFDTDRITEFAVWLRHPELLPRVEKRLAEALGGNFELLRWDEERLSPYYVGTVEFLDTIVFAGAIVMSVIIALSVLNSATMTILERSQEIGMYRAMGFRRSHVRQLYVQESLWLSGMSLLAGFALGSAAIKAVNASEIVYHPPGFAGGITLKLILPWNQPALVGALILGLVALATFFAVSNRLRPTPADLLGGTLR